jgi:hypothetical protein
LLEGAVTDDRGEGIDGASVVLLVPSVPCSKLAHVVGRTTVLGGTFALRDGGYLPPDLAVVVFPAEGRARRRVSTRIRRAS